MNRFLLFAGCFDTSGGWHNYQGSDDDLFDAIKRGREIVEVGHADWFHVVDTEIAQIVHSSED